MKAVVAAFNQEKALVGAFSVITNPRMELFQALQLTPAVGEEEEGEEPRHAAARHGHARVSSGYQASFPIPSWCCQSLIFHHISKSCETI